MLKYDPKERISAREALQHDFFRMGAASDMPPNGRLCAQQKEASTTAEPAEAAVQGLGGSASGAASHLSTSAFHLQDSHSFHCFLSRMQERTQEAKATLY